MNRVTAALTLYGVLTCATSEAESLTDHLYIKFGGMRAGSGIGGGFELRNDHFINGAVDVRLESKVSIRLYQQHEIELIDPHFLDPRWYVEVLGLYRSYTQVDFFGIGPDSNGEDQTDYRIDGTAVFGTVGFRPGRGHQVGVRAGYMNARIGPGTDDSLPGITDVFDPGTVPGLNAGTSHVLVGAFVAFDFRDDSEDPSSGAYYEIQSTHYEDVGNNLYSFRDLDYDVQHFLRLGRRLTLALRASGIFTAPAAGQQVPFYLLPSLGGSDSLHAFENDRFRDRHMVFLNNELRWRATPTIRVELFVDAGEVFPRVDAFRISALELSYGAGVRYKFGRSILVGVSAGYGREGARVSFKGDFRF